MTNPPPSREARLQEALYKVCPLYEFIGLSVFQLGSTVRFQVPLSRSNTNHFGAMHAGVLFTLAELTGGICVTQHRDLGKLTLIATNIEMDYVRAAKSAVRGEATLSEEFLDSIRTGLEKDPKFAFTVPVDLKDELDALVARSRCSFQLRAPRPNR